jgi:hypothetical protein
MPDALRAPDHLRGSERAEGGSSMIPTSVA